MSHSPQQTGQPSQKQNPKTRSRKRVSWRMMSAACALALGAVAFATLIAVNPASLAPTPETDPASAAEPLDEATLAHMDEEEAMLQEYRAALSEGRQGTGQSEGQDEAQDSASQAELPPYVPNEVLVVLDKGCTAEELEGRLKGLNYIADQTITESQKGSGWAVVKLAEGQGVEEAVERLVADGVAKTVQPNYLYTLDESDSPLASGLPEASSQLVDGAHPGEDVQPANGVQLPDEIQPANGVQLPDEIQPANAYLNDTLIGNQYGLISMQGDQAVDFAKGKSLNASTRPWVAVLDSGAYVDHPDLKDNIVDYYDAVNAATKQQYESANRTFYDFDLNGSHGTHICGLIAAKSNNARGVAGISADVGIVPIRVAAVYLVDGQYKVATDSSSLATAYKYVDERANKIKVVNLSIGHNGDTQGVSDKDFLVLDWIDLASSDDILTVSAAGNDAYEGPYRNYPTYYAETALGVIALTNDSNQGHLGTSTVYDWRADFSNYNMAGALTEEVAAPGVNIVSTMAWTDADRSAWVPSTDTPYSPSQAPLTMSEQYGYLSGTSQAAPLVAGTAALVRWINPALSVNQVKSLLMSNASASYSPQQGMGKVNAYNAVADAAAGGGSYLSGASSLAPGVSSKLTPSRAASDWQYSSADNAIATVDAMGTVTGVAGGGTVIRARSASLGKELVQAVTVHEPSITGESSVNRGHTIQLGVADAKVGSGLWTWVSENQNIAVVSESGVVTGISAGTARIRAVLTTNSNVVAYKTITVNAPAPAPVVRKVVMHRLYNPYSGEHFYTASIDELRGLVRVGWTYEGVGWNAPDSGSNVYRLYNKWSGDHHFTTSASEKDQCVAAGWTYEGVGWKSGGSVKVYREYNPYAPAFYHNYTASAQEHAGLIGVGWRDEGVGWYGV